MDWHSFGNIVMSTQTLDQPPPTLSQLQLGGEVPSGHAAPRTARDIGQGRPGGRSRNADRSEHSTAAATNEGLPRRARTVCIDGSGPIIDYPSRFDADPRCAAAPAQPLTERAMETGGSGDRFNETGHLTSGNVARKGSLASTCAELSQQFRIPH